MILLAGVPAVLLIVALFAPLAHYAEVARASFRVLRYVVVLELCGLVALACFGLAYEKLSSDRARRAHPIPGKLIDVGGYRMHLSCSGDGSPTVVLAYGMSGSYLDWHQVQPQIAKFARVCSYDRAGYGWSELSSKPRVPSVHAQELHALLEGAGEKPPYILVGHSLGGFDVVMYAHTFPEQVVGVVLVDSAHPDSNIKFGWRDRAQARFFQITAPFGLPRWRKWCLQGPEEIAEQKSAFNCAGRVFESNYQLRDAYSAAADEMRSIRSIGDIPLVVISRDPNRNGIVSRASEHRWSRFQESLVRLSAKGRRVVAQGSSHAVPLERPEIVTQCVRNMVNTCR